MEVGDYTAPSTRFSQEEAMRKIRLAAGGDRQEFDWQIQRANDELRWIRVNLSPTEIGGQSCVISEVRDVTESRARERRLRLLSRVIRHNLRNKTNVLMGYADRVRQARRRRDARTRDRDDDSEHHDRGRGLSDSVKQIEEIAEPTATQRSPTDLRRVVRSLVEDGRAEYPAADIEVDAPEEVWVIADTGIRYAIEHALRNAIEHNDRESPSVTVSVIDEERSARG